MTDELPTVGRLKLGRMAGATVAQQGLGCMGMSHSYGPADRDEAARTIHEALDLGVTFLDTADVYGNGHNETLVGEAIQGRRDEVFLATKFGILRDPANPAALVMRGSSDYVHAACDASLKRLGVNRIDLFYQHRVDLEVPIEETVGAMSELVAMGKVHFLGLSEASASHIREAQAVHPIAAVQSEWSLWTRDIETQVVPTCRELGISIVAYAPIGRGFLAGELKSPHDLSEGDSRRRQPRFQSGNLDRNLGIVAEMKRLAEAKGCSSAQLALAWSRYRGPDVVPIPGTKTREHLRQNVASLAIELTQDDLRAIEAAVPPESVFGERYADMTFVNR